MLIGDVTYLALDDGRLVPGAGADSEVSEEYAQRVSKTEPRYVVRRDCRNNLEYGSRLFLRGSPVSRTSMGRES